MDEFFFGANDFPLLAKYQANKCCKQEAFIQRCSVKKVTFKNLAKLTRKSLSQSLFLIKLQFKKSLWHRFFSCEYSEVFKNTFCIEYLRWLPLVNLEPRL